jgi:hypothetical protein
MQKDIITRINMQKGKKRWDKDTRREEKKREDERSKNVLVGLTSFWRDMTFK